MCVQVGCEPRHKRCLRCENPALADSGSGNHFGRWQRYWRRGVHAMIRVGVRKKEISAMRRWYLPLTVLGVASLGALILTQRGRQALAWLADNFDQADTLFEWNDTQRELERLRAAVNQLADSLETGC
jgi:HAMP domain-containing protein